LRLRWVLEDDEAPMNFMVVEMRKGLQVKLGREYEEKIN
jgi:hypothetical protein